MGGSILPFKTMFRATLEQGRSFRIRTITPPMMLCPGQLADFPGHQLERRQFTLVLVCRGTIVSGRSFRSLCLHHLCHGHFGFYARV